MRSPNGGRATGRDTMRRRRVVAHSVGRLAVALAMGPPLGAAMLRHRLSWQVLPARLWFSDSERAALRWRRRRRDAELAHVGLDEQRGAHALCSPARLS